MPYEIQMLRQENAALRQRKDKLNLMLQTWNTTVWQSPLPLLNAVDLPNEIQELRGENIALKQENANLAASVCTLVGTVPFYG